MKLFGDVPNKKTQSQRTGPEKRRSREGDELETEYDIHAAENEGSGVVNGLIIAGSALLTILVVVGIGVLIINYFLDLINFQAANSDYFPTVQTEEELPEEEAINEHLAAIDEAEAGLEATPEELERWNKHIEDVVSDDSTYEVPISEDVFNILLIGSDTRVRGEVGRSDAMILLSINQKTETIYLTSFLRDSYVAVPGWGHTRLNHAFAYEGPDLLEQTLEENFKVHVDRYAAVDFFSFMDVIDILGGVWIDVSEDERIITDEYIWSMNKLMNQEWSTDYIWSSGWQQLNGKQALCYARNRYTGNDFDRTQRQRNIINQIIVGAKKASASQLVELAQVILPQITTDLSKSEILSYAANLGAYKNFEIISQQIPAAGTYSGATIDGMSVISMDLDANIKYLQGTVYAGTEYNFEAQEIQTSEDYSSASDEGYSEFFYREEWADVEWDKIDWDKVDWYNTDFDSEDFDWSEFYYEDADEAEKAAKAAKASAAPSATSSPVPSAKAGTAASPSPSSIKAPSATPAKDTDDEN